MVSIHRAKQLEYHVERVDGGSGASKDSVGVARGQKSRDGPNKSDNTRKATVTAPLRIGFGDSYYQPLVPSFFHSSFFVLSFYNTHNHFSFNFSSSINAISVIF